MINKKLILIFAVMTLIVVISGGVYYMMKGNNNGAVQPVSPDKHSEKPKITPQSLLSKDIILTADKQIYGLGDKIKIKAFVRNSFSENKKWTANNYLVLLDGGFSTVGQSKELILKPLQIGEAEFFMEVNNSLVDGKYNIKLDIVEDKVIIGTKLVLIEIRGVGKKIDIDVSTCADKDCQQIKSVFNKNETVYFKADSSVESVNIKATLKIPNQKITDIVFKNGIASYSLQGADEGNYSLWVFASKEGYFEEKVEKTFSVLSSSVEIKSSAICNVDKKCEDGETAQNCPQDCLLNPVK